MSKTVKEWEEHFQELTPDQREDLRNALIRVEEDSWFKAEFEWTGLFAMKFLISNVEMNAVGKQLPEPGKSTRQKWTGKERYDMIYPSASTSWQKPLSKKEATRIAENEREGNRLARVVKHKSGYGVFVRNK